VNTAINLLTAVPLWLFVALIFCAYKVYRLWRSDKTTIGRKWSWTIALILLVFVHFVNFQILYNGLFFAGPASGQIVDANTAKPIAGARVMLVWRTAAAPIAMPWYTEIFDFECSIYSEPVFADGNGKYSFRWHGDQVIHGGCIDASIYVHVPTYDSSSANIDLMTQEQSATAAFGKVLIHLKKVPVDPYGIRAGEPQ
jgi:hypothetical protein